MKITFAISEPPVETPYLWRKAGAHILCLLKLRGTDVTGQAFPRFYFKPLSEHPTIS